jgi:uncharacterized protein (DUF1330 family)
MAAYLVSQVEVIDESEWKQYGEMAAPAIASYGGRYLIRGAAPEVIESDWEPPDADRQIMIVAEFPSMEALHRWYGSPEYAKAFAHRRTAVKRRLLFVEGVEEPMGT